MTKHKTTDSEPRMTYVTIDGMRVSGTVREVVRALRDAQWNAPEYKRDWMEQVAERIAHIAHAPGTRLTFSNAQEFIDELVRVELLTIAS